MNHPDTPLFPLNTVLFPGGILSLRLFEPRYLDMVSACMKSGTGFGVCLIREGRESGSAASIHGIGTLATIIDWQTLPDGLLGITALGQQRFSVLSHRVQSNQLVLASIELLPGEPEAELPTRYLDLADLLRQARTQLGHSQTNPPERYTDAGWVGSRLAELLPIELSIKQELLQLNDPVQRLERIYSILDRHGSREE